VVHAADADMAIVTYRSTDKGTYDGHDLSGQYRWLDVFAKRGGTWQCIVSQGTNADGAQLLARRILDEIGDCPFEVSDGNLVRKTCSIGWAIFPWIGKVPVAVPVEEIIKLSDRALYQAKQGGRNCAVGYW